MKVSFGPAIIQKLRRIAIDPNLLANMGLSEGDRVHLFLDTETQSIIIEKDSSTPHLTRPLGKSKK